MILLKTAFVSNHSNQYIHNLLTKNHMKTPILLLTTTFLLLLISTESHPIQQRRLLEAIDMAYFLPEHTPTARFFKYMFARLDDGDVRSLAVVMKGEYTKLCAELEGCEWADFKLRDLYRIRYNEAELNMGKINKMGLLLQRLVAED